MRSIVGFLGFLSMPRVLCMLDMKIGIIKYVGYRVLYCIVYTYRYHHPSKLYSKMKYL